MNPSSHGEFRDEDIAALGEEDGSLGRDHFDVRIGFHDFFDAREGQLVEFVVVGFGFEVVDGLLPVRGEDVAVVAYEALVYLFVSSLLAYFREGVFWDEAIGEKEVAYVRPCPLIQLRHWRKALSRQLHVQSASNLPSSKPCPPVPPHLLSTFLSSNIIEPRDIHTAALAPKSLTHTSANP